MHICTQCQEQFKSGPDFDRHDCVVNAMELSQRELLDKLYETGGCSEEYYRKALAKLEKES